MSALAVYRVLIVDDTPAIHEDFRKVFTTATTVEQSLDATADALFGDDAGAAPPTAEFVVDSAMQGREGADLLRRSVEENRPYALAFVDMRMPPGWDGLETIQNLWKIDPRLQVVICTAHSDHSWHDINRVLGHSDSLIVLKKPFGHVEARQIAHAFAQKWTLGRENEKRLAELNALVEERTKQVVIAEERFSTAFRANPAAQSLIALDPFEVLEVNPEFTRQFGFSLEDIKHENPETFRRGLDPGRWRALIGRLLAGQPVDEHPFVFERGTGDLRELRCSARLVQLHGRPCSLWIMRDVTEHNRLEAQLRQAQKMDAVGQLAAGVAHDFNNILTAIQTYSSLILSGDAPMEDLVQVQDAASRASALTRQLLLFSSRQLSQREPVNVAQAFGNIMEMLRRLLPERLGLDWRAEERLPHILADITNLEQVVMNLVINARDATVGHGVITVSIDTAVLAQPLLNRHPKARAGKFVRLSVGDTGSGMPAEVMAKIFEPFFTTKESGKGTGLGLSTVYGIVDQHEGWVEVASEVGQGTTFKIYFPALEGSDAMPAALPSAAAAGEGLAPAGIGKRLLIVEDDGTVRSASARIARAAGYQVTVAEDGFDALQAWREAEQRFDIVFSDVEMPNGMSGVDLARQLRRDRPDVKIILTTGYSGRLLNGAADGLKDLPVLGKPFTRGEFLAKLAEENPVAAKA